MTGTDPSQWVQVLDWTTLTPATSISIPIAASYNAMQETQHEATYRYQLTNLAGTS
jgi:hypothetical protein